jgi:hypothetical protein
VHSSKDQVHHHGLRAYSSPPPKIFFILFFKFYGVALIKCITSYRHPRISDACGSWMFSTETLNIKQGLFPYPHIFYF